ncbi:MAG: small multi-drug export protein, partial [Flavobacteriaceae bacterium]|nr:small multi-drug export protein [Flavobacteriaceae bacterium]
MAGLSIGIATQMDTTLLVGLNFFIESVMVLILYPLFVLSWKKIDLISYPPLRKFLAKSKKNAHTYEPLIKRYGVIGLILFVLTPFAMTGP